VRAAADALVQQLSSEKPEVRENAATALEAMGNKAAKALASQICRNLPNSSSCTPTPTPTLASTATPTITPSPTPKAKRKSSIIDMQGTIKAVVVLGKIGNDVADDDEVRQALRSAASQEEQTDWPQLQLAAIDALREINKYRGGILAIEDNNPKKTFDPAAAIGCADLLAQTAEKVFEKSTVRSVPTPTPTPPDEEFYSELKILCDSQAKLLKAAAQVSAGAAPSKPEKPVFSKLTDAKTLAESLRRIEVGYSDATKTIDTTKLKLENTYDKTAWQFQTEAAYDLLTETSELRDQLHKALDPLKKNREDLATLVLDLATISANADSFPRAAHEAIDAAVASALNGIFSKPPEKKPATQTDKKEDGTKKDAAKKEMSKSE